MIYKKSVSLHHTAFDLGSVYINNRIRLFQNGTVGFLRSTCPPARLRYAGQDAVQFDFRLLCPDRQNCTGTVLVYSLSHTAEKMDISGVAQFFNLVGKFFLQRNAGRGVFIIMPGQLSGLGPVNAHAVWKKVAACTSCLEISGFPALSVIFAPPMENIDILIAIHLEILIVTIYVCQARFSLF